MEETEKNEIKKIEMNETDNEVMEQIPKTDEGYLAALYFMLKGVNLVCEKMTQRQGGGFFDAAESAVLHIEHELEGANGGFMSRGAKNLLGKAEKKKSEAFRLLRSIRNENIVKLRDILSEHGMKLSYNELCMFLDKDRKALPERREFTGKISEICVFCKAFDITRAKLNASFMTRGKNQTKNIGEINSNQWAKAIGGHKRDKTPQWLRDVDNLFQTDCVKIWEQGVEESEEGAKD